MILTKFRDDDVGRLCKSEHLIKIYGLRNFPKVLARKEKQKVLRETLMTDMRRLATLYLTFKEKAKSQNLEITCFDEMLQADKIKIPRDALSEMTTKEDGSMKSGLRYGLGYLLKKANNLI